VPDRVAARGLDVFPTALTVFLAESESGGATPPFGRRGTPPIPFTLCFRNGWPGGVFDPGWSKPARGAISRPSRTRESALRTDLDDLDRVSTTGMLCRRAAIGAARFVVERKAAPMADVLYVVLLIAVFAVMGLALRGLERL
jgi:hypothetical protein